MQAEHGPGWDDESAAHLTKLWADGLSAGQIGIRMGKTRNAILGKVHRLSLPARATRHRSARAPAGRRAYTPPSRPRLVPAEQPPALLTIVPRIVQELNIPTALRVDLLDLREGMCRFPIGDPKEPGFHFCGRRQEDGTSYCGHHDRITRQPAKPRQSSFFRLEALHG